MVLDYPSILRRYFSTVIDAVIIVLGFISISYVFDHLNTTDKAAPTIRLLLIVFIFFIYEPLFTSKFCTLGQKITGIRIRRIVENQYVKIPIISAYFRLLVKLFLGVLSIFSIPFTKGKRAIHDFAANSIVIPARFSPDADLLNDELDRTEKPKKRIGFWGKTIISTLVLLILAILVAGNFTVEIEVIPGSRLNPRYLETIHQLNLLDKDEKIFYFYSDALFSIKEGFYFLSNKKVAIFREDADEPISVPFEEIADLEIAYSDGFFEDSDVYLTLKNEEIVWFPLSHEEGGDKKFFAKLYQLVQSSR
jgi:uncharacterized RDD family membrane protein YckC